MLKYLTTILVLLVSVQVAQAKTIVLTDKNTVILRAPFDPKFTKSVKKDLLNLSAKGTKEIYLYLNTPGGSITDGLELMEVIKGLKAKVHTITQFAASMGFVTVELNVGKRYILDTGVLMTHRAFAGIQGQLPGELDTRLAFWHNILYGIDTIISSRLGLTVDQYRKLNYNEFWVEGQKAVSSNMADEIVNVQCSDSLSGTYQENVDTLFGPVGVVWSKCPLISEPMDLIFSSIKTKDNHEVVEIKQLFNDIFSNSNVRNGKTGEILSSEKFKKYIR